MTFLHSGYHSKITLSAQQMLEISQEISRDFTPCFSSRMPQQVEKIRLSPRELLDIGEEIGRSFAPTPSYNTPELMLLPVDPRHLYAYWNLGKIATPEHHSKEQLTLRIYSQAEAQDTAGDTASWFDVAIDSPKTSQPVPLPDAVEKTTYSAAIGLSGADDSFIALACSNIIQAPYEPTSRTQEHENSTVSLNKSASGLGIVK